MRSHLRRILAMISLFGYSGSLATDMIPSCEVAVHQAGSLLKIRR